MRSPPNSSLAKNSPSAPTQRSLRSKVISVPMGSHGSSGCAVIVEAALVPGAAVVAGPAVVAAGCVAPDVPDPFAPVALLLASPPQATRLVAARRGTTIIRRPRGSVLHLRCVFIGPLVA